MTVELPQTDRFRELFLGDVPMLDVRAPVEFTAGAFPNAVNHPLIDDRERHRIGIEYAERGPQAATELGHELVAGELRERRVATWSAFAREHPDGVLYCFRGGQRSRISQQWLYQATGIAYPRVSGGYKRLRRFLLDEMERILVDLQLLMVGGKTGSGKTRLLQDQPGFVDLEHLAWHRGSAFGPHATPQPTQIDFENALAVALLKHEVRGGRLILEDESENIGGLWLPKDLVRKMRQSPCVLLERDLATRVDISLQEYVIDTLHEHQLLHGQDDGFDSWSGYLLASLDKIRKRLGGELHARLRGQLAQALGIQRGGGDTASHRVWIEGLLVNYYDKMYEYQIAKRRDRILYRGDPDGVRDFLRAVGG